MTTPRRWYTTFLLLLATATSTSSLPAQSSLRPGWARADLRVLVDTIRLKHPKLRDTEVRRRFDSVVASVERGIDSLPRHRAIMELARVVASLEDGHTQLGLAWDAGIGFHRYPLRVFLFDDGVYITHASPDARSVLGGQLIRIGSLTIDTVVARLRPYLHGDNDYNRRDILETRLTLHEVLETIGAVTGDSGRFVVRRADGRLDSVMVRPLTFGTAPQLLAARDTAAALPLHMALRRRTYDFAMVPGTTTMFAQINAVQNDSAESLAAFADRLFTAIAQQGAERLVLDLRYNNGGDNTLNRDLLRRIIRGAEIDQPGRFYVLIGRKTFSAAVNLVSDLETFTRAIFVGESTAAPANHYGETTLLSLPNSGIRAIYSSLFWQGGDPRDMRAGIEPAIRVPVIWADYRNNRDAALEAVLALPVPGR